MIIDKFSNAKLYGSLHPRLKKGIEYLLETDLVNLPVGTYEIEGKKVFLMIQEYDTRVEEECFWEAHYQYTDIQYMVKGDERMGYSNHLDLQVTKADKEKDLILLEGEGDLYLIKEGSFAIFFPQDAHKPCACSNQPQFVKKAVIKALCD